MVRIAFAIHRVEFSIPLGIAYLSGVLKKAGCDVDVFEIGTAPKKALKAIRDFAPDIVAYSIMSGDQDFYLAFNKDLKRSIACVAVFGGPHLTFFPEMIRDESVDAICVGEGELALEEFVRKFSDLKEIPTDVKNFWVRKGSAVIKNPVRPLVKDLDALPFPDRKIFYDKFSIVREHGRKHFLAHRGCPYQCAYCFNKPYNEMYEGEKIYRLRNPHKICEEINNERASVRMDMVGFVDDCFTLDKDWIRVFSSVYKKEVGIPFHINTRFDNLDDEIVAHLKEANCALVLAGIESGNDFIRNTVMKRHMSVDTILKGAGFLKKYKINFLTENITGNPGEDFEKALDTIRLNIRIKPNFANCSFFSPYPKLEMTKYAIEHNFFDGDFSKLNINYYHNIPIAHPNKHDVKKMLNMRCFFSLIVKHPRLLSFFDKAIFNISPNRLFRRIGDLIDGYYMKQLLPYRMGIFHTVKTALQYFFIYRRESH